MSAKYCLVDCKSKKTFALKEGSNIVGRTMGEIIFPFAEKMSRRHFKLDVMGAKVFISDLKSTNGTLVDGVMVKENENKILNHGSIIEFGNMKMVFEINSSLKLGTNPRERLPDVPSVQYEEIPVKKESKFDKSAIRRGIIIIVIITALAVLIFMDPAPK